MTELSYENPPPTFELTCSYCGHLVFGQNPLQTLFLCPACNTEFIRPMHEQIDARADELSLHIQNVSTLRRAVHRTRSHFIVGAGACFIAVIEMMLLVVRCYRYHAWFGAIVAFAAGVGLSMLLRHCITRLRQLTRELQESKMPTPTDAQDFSTLGDGSQRVRDLENLTG